MNIFELDQSIRKQKSANSNGGISKEKETEFHADLDKLVHKTFGKRKDEDHGVAEAIPYALSAANANAEYERTKTFVPRGYKGRVDTEVSSQDEYNSVMAALKKLAQAEGQHVECGLSGNKMSIFSKTLNSSALDEFIDMALEDFDQGVAEGSLEEIDRRGFLRGLGAAALGAAGVGAATTAQARATPEWMQLYGNAKSKFESGSNIAQVAKALGVSGPNNGMVGPWGGDWGAINQAARDTVGLKPEAPATAGNNKPAASGSQGFSKEYLQRAADPNRTGRYMISVEKAKELLSTMKEGVAEDSSNHVWIQGDFDGDTVASGPTQGSWRDQESTPVELVRGIMSNVRRLSGPPPSSGNTIKQAKIPLILDAGSQQFNTIGRDLQLTVAPNGYITQGKFGRVVGTAVVKIMKPGSVEEDLNEFSPAGSGTPPRGPKTPGRDPWGGNDDGEDPYNRPKPRHYRRSSSYFEQFEADHFDKEDYDKATGVFKGYWENDDGSFTQIGYFKFDDPTQTGGDDPGMGWYYEPQNESVAEAINPDITNPEFSHKQQIGDYLYVARYWRKGLKISAYHGDKQIGYAELMYHSAPFDDFADPKTTPKRIWLESEWTKVNPKYQRQGIMSTMYAYAKMLGNSVKPSQTRSDDAKAAWKSWRDAGDAKYLTQSVDKEETEYGPEWDEKVQRLKKLAGMGPLKTVWDPVKRVYKNVPVNKDKDVDEASLATMRDYFDGNLDAQDPTKISQMRKFFAKQHVPSKEIITKKFHKPDEYQQWISKVKPMATKNVREAGPYSRGYYNPMDDERREQEWSDRSTRDWKYRERASEEASVLYIFRPDLGKLRQRMWNHDQFREARAEGYKDSPDQAMKAFGYFPSKFKRGHYVKKGLDGKWESIFPYTDTNKPVGENTSTITLTMNDGSNKLLRSGTTALNAVKSVLSYLVRSKDFETLKNLKAVDGQDVTGIVSKIFKPSNTIDLGEALDTEFQSFLKQAKHRYPDSKDETEAFMRFVHDELEKEGRIDRSQASEIDDLEAKIDSLIIDLAKVSKAPPAVGL